MRRRRGVLLLAAILASLATVPSQARTAGGPPGPDETGQCGVVRSGDSPVGAAEVTLYRAGDEPGAEPQLLARARSGPDGAFRLSYERPADPTAVLYLFADAAPDPAERAAGRRGEAVRLAAVLGNGPALPQVVVNERTTVAAAYALARFADRHAIAGTNPGLRNAAAISHNLADVGTGEVAQVLATPPNGALTSTLAAFNTLADILAGCVDGRTCAELFALTREPGQPEPRDTFQAAVAIAHAPGRHAAELFALAAAAPRYRPSLPSAPDAWTVALRYSGNGHELDGPGNIAFDAAGNAWVANNYRFAADPRESVCGGRAVLKFTPTGEDAPGAPFRGGGLYGAGFGVTVDPKGQAWVGNFGFQGAGCELDENRFNRSVSQFAGDGTALSPDTGWRGGGIVQPQGVVADRAGNVWIANCGGRSVTRIPDGRADRAHAVATESLDKPFGVAVDPAGRAWVTGNGSDSVQVLSPDGTPERSVTGGGLRRPLGVATDSEGNAWVSNSGIVPLPCEGTTPADTAEAVAGVTVPHPGASVTLIRPDGSTPDGPFTNDGLFLPWGIAVDGDDTVWVANFGGHRVARLCGVRLSACPPGHRTGQPISPPDTGYTSDGLDRNTGIQIDPSGNVWLTNNWQTVPLQTNPGGHELVVLIGAAAPVRPVAAGEPSRP
ncbi:NHL repeat-containing protein [Kitasatospora sp. NPDC059327]|uniref:NHL repeat-containing protein n=1 Tax=Kitasatospora sp. NPDC059327 TaxID=3346803 RepID=UPI00367F5052